MNGDKIKWADLQEKSRVLYKDEKEAKEGDEFFDNCAPAPGESFNFSSEFRIFKIIFF